MKCPKHPERWPMKDFNSNELSAVLECPGCLEAFKDQVLAEIEPGEIPPVPDGFADRVLDHLDRPSGWAAKLEAGPETGRQRTNSKRLMLIHYMAAAAATIAMVLLGGFNLIFQSASDYSAALNHYINNVTEVTTKVSIKSGLYQNVKHNLDGLVKSTLDQKVK